MPEVFGGFLSQGLEPAVKPNTKRVLGIDPGATRCGYAVVDKKDDKPHWVASGVIGVKREDKEEYQKYRMRLIEFWSEESRRLLLSFNPDLVASEIVPVVGGGNFVVATQSQLASTVITVIQATALRKGFDCEQFGATTVKARIGKSKKATKVGVRNGVYQLMPEMKVRDKQWKSVSDESDAFAIALTALGYRNER